MNKSNKYELIINIRRMKSIMSEASGAARKAAENRTLIANDQDHSQEWKARYYSMIDDVEQDRYRSLGEKAAPIADYFKGVRETIEQDFDFQDSTLQNALNIIQISRENLPYPMRKQIAESFRGNPTALATIKPLYERYGYGTAHFDDLMLPFERDETAVSRMIDEFIGKATVPKDSPIAAAMGVKAQAKWEPDSMLRLLNDYEKGLALDIDCNPYLSEIKAMRDNTKDPSKAARIRRFLSKYEEQLAEDEPAAVEMAENAISDDFTRPIL